MSATTTTPGHLNDRQLDGWACILCGAEPDRMVPAGYGSRGQLFACADSCADPRISE